MPHLPSPIPIDRRQQNSSHRRDSPQRVGDGDDPIVRARLDGSDVSAWEAFWSDLVQSYEAVCEDVRPAA